MKYYTLQLDFAVADLILSVRENIEGNLEWCSSDFLTGKFITGIIKPEEKELFWKGVYIALSGDDTSLDDETYRHLAEDVLGFVGDNVRHPAR